MNNNPNNRKPAKFDERQRIFERAFPSDESRKCNRYNGASPFLFNNPIPIYERSNCWNFSNPPLKFRYDSNKNRAYQIQGNNNANDQEEEEEENNHPEEEYEKRKFEKIPNVNEQFRFFKDVEFPDWKREISSNEQTSENIESFSEIFSPTVFHRNETPKMARNLIGEQSSLSHFSTDKLKEKFALSNEIHQKMVIENNEGMETLEKITNSQLKKFENDVLNRIRSSYNLALKTKESLEKKRNLCQLSFENEKAPFSKILIQCSDSLEIIFSFLTTEFVISKLSLVCSFFLSYIEKRVKLDFIIREDYRLFLYPLEKIFTKYSGVRGFKYYNYNLSIQEKSFNRILKIIESNKKTLRKISIFPHPNIINNSDESSNTLRRWNNNNNNNREEENDDKKNIVPEGGYVDIRFQRSDSSVQTKVDLNTYEMGENYMEKIRNVISECSYLEFLELQNPPDLSENFPFLKGISMICFRRYVSSRNLSSLKFSYLFLGSRNQVDDIINKRKKKVEEEIINEFKRLIKFLESDRNRKRIEYVNLCRKQLSESRNLRKKEIREIYKFSKPYFSRLFFLISKLKDLAEVILPIFGGLELLSDDIIQAFPRLNVTLSKFGGLENNNIDDTKNNNILLLRHQFKEKVRLISSVLEPDPKKPNHHQLSPLWKDTFSVCYDEMSEHEAKEIELWLSVPNICLFLSSEILPLNEVPYQRGYDYLFNYLDIKNLKNLDRVKMFRLHFSRSIDLRNNIGFSNLFSSHLKYISFIISDECSRDRNEKNILVIVRSILHLARLHGKCLEKLVCLIIEKKYTVYEDTWDQIIGLVSSENNDRLKILEVRPPSTMKEKYFSYIYCKNVDIKLDVREERVNDLYESLKNKNKGLKKLSLWKFEEIQKNIDSILKVRNLE